MNDVKLPTGATKLESDYESTNGHYLHHFFPSMSNQQKCEQILKLEMN